MLLKKSLLTVECPDDECFIYSILASLYPQKTNPGRYRKYKGFERNLKVDHITYPVDLKQIPQFGKDNNLSINCYGYEKVIYPLIVSKNQSGKEIDLLLFRGHYYLIRNLSRLIASGNRRQNKCFI